MDLEIIWFLFSLSIVQLFLDFQRQWTMQHAGSYVSYSLLTCHISTYPVGNLKTMHFVVDRLLYRIYPLFCYICIFLGQWTFMELEDNAYNSNHVAK